MKRVLAVQFLLLLIVGCGVGAPTAPTPTSTASGVADLPPSTALSAVLGLEVKPPLSAGPLFAPGAADVGLGGSNEPTIAVDPNNPVNIAYSSLLELRVSIDGGNSWSFVTSAGVAVNSDEDGDGVDGEDPIEAGVDNDRDGAIDEDPVNGVDDDVDGLVDEDPAANIDNDGDGQTNEDPCFQRRCGDPSLAYDSQGRLFWTTLACSSGRVDGDGDGVVTGGADGSVFVGIDALVYQVNPTSGAILPGYPVNLTAAAGLGGCTLNPANPAGQGFEHDKEWLAADANAASPFADRLYVVWSDLTPGSPSRIRSTFSADQGMTWSAPVTHSAAAGEGFVWAPHVAVASNGDVYMGYHSQPVGPNGVSGQIFVTRSTDGGVTFPQKTSPYAPGQADFTWNVRRFPSAPSNPIPNCRFWLQGSRQPWILPDPTAPGNVYVVASDDPDNSLAPGGDFADVFIARSTNNGVAWNAPVRIDNGPGAALSVMPTAAIDSQTGCIAVTYYDDRNGATNANGSRLLDVFLTASTDGGLTFGPDVQINDTAFDPDLGAATRHGPFGRDDDGDGAIDEDPIDGVDNDLDGAVDEDPGLVDNDGDGLFDEDEIDGVDNDSDGATDEDWFDSTLRIGEYNGVAAGNCNEYAVWCGNTATGQQTIFDMGFSLCDAAPPTVSCSVTRQLLFPIRGGILPPPLLRTITDDCDPSPAATVTVYSDEADLGPPFSPDAGIIDALPGDLWLRADRDIRSNGRVYLILVGATDSANKSAYGCCAVVVPRILSAGSILSVLSEAAAAQAGCDLVTGTPPAAYSTVVLATTALP